MEPAVVLSRLVQYAAVSIVGGSSLFFLYGYRPDIAQRWPKLLVQTAAIVGVAGGTAWLMTEAASLGDGPADAFDPIKVWGVAVGASFGVAALVRIGLFAVALGLASLRRSTPWGLLAALGLGAAASFAWTGHGSADDGPAGVAHLGADVVHMGAAAVWIGALCALLILLLRHSRKGAAPSDAAPAALAAFSRIGPLVVSALIASGLINGWFMVGPGALASLTQTPYGRLLIVKLGLFGLMLGLAAANRYVVTPRLARAAAGARGAEGLARVSLIAETLLAFGVLILVSWLGTLSPSGDI